MTCTITHKGKVYTPQEFAKLLKDPIFAEEVRILVVTDKFLEKSDEWKGVKTAPEVARELADAGLMANNITSDLAKVSREISRRTLNGEKITGIEVVTRSGGASIWSELKSKGIKAIPKSISNAAQKVNLKLGQGVIKGLSKRVYEASILSKGRIREKLKAADRNAAELNRVIKKYSNILSDKDKLAITDVLKGADISIIKLNSATSQDQKDAIRAELKNIVDKLRTDIDNTTRNLIELGFISEGSIDIYQNNLGQYVTRIYQVNLHPEKWWNDLTKDPKLGQVFERGKTFVKNELEGRRLRMENLIADVRSRINDASKLPQSKENDVLLETLQKRYDRLQRGAENIDRILSSEDTLVDYIQESIGATGDDTNLVKGERSDVRTDQSIFKRRKNIPEEIRQLKGEVVDADAAYAATIKKMVEFEAKYSFQMEFALMGENVLFSTVRDSKAGFTEAMNISNLPGMRDILSVKDNVIYVMPEIAEEFSGVMKNANPWVTSMKTLNSIAKWGATVGNPVTQLRNFSSAFTFLLFNGHLLNPNVFKTTVTVAREIGAEVAEGVTGKDFRNPTLKAVFDSALRNGVVNSSVDISEISDLYRNSFWDKLSRYLDNKSKYASLPVKGLSTVIETLNALYAGSDNVIKVAAYLAELDQFAPTVGKYKNYNDILAKSAAGDQQAIDDIKKLEYKAAKRVRETIPNYAESWRVNELIRDNVPLIGTFTTFTTEMIRTQYNGIASVMDDISSSTNKDMTPEAKKAYLKMSLYRMAGVSATLAATFGGEYLREILASLTADDEDDDKDIAKKKFTSAKERDVFVKYFAPPWVKQVDLTRDISEDGSFVYTDVSSINPYAMLNNFSLVGRVKSESTAGKLAELIAPTIAPFVSPEMGISMIKRYLEGEDEFGRKISEYSIVDNPKEFLKDFFRSEKVKSEILPGLIKEFTRYAKKDEAIRALESKMEQGTPEQQIEWKRQIKQHQENMANTFKAYKHFGFKENYVNVHLATKFPAYEFTDKVDGLRRSYLARVMDDSQNFEKIYKGINTSYKKELNKMRTMVKETKDVLGVDITDDIDKVFNLNKVPKDAKAYVFGISDSAPDFKIADYNMRKGDDSGGNSELEKIRNKYPSLQRR